MNLLSPLLREALRPPDRILPSEWVNAHRILDPVNCAEPGPCRIERTPYAIEWLDNQVVKHVRHTTVMKSTQIAGTETLLNVLGYAIDQEPAPIMLVRPNKEDAIEFGEQRVTAMIEASPSLRRHLSTRKHDAKKRKINFDRCVLYFRGAQSPSDLASVPVRWLLCDELDKWPRWVGREASPLDLAEERTRTFHNFKVYKDSTPTTREGLIYREFLKGDQRRFWVPCPTCERYQVLRFQQIKWDKAIRTELDMKAARRAQYECEHCHDWIRDESKGWMLARGVWVPEAAGDGNDVIVDGVLDWTDDPKTDHRSYHIWAGYSPWLCWWEIAAKFLDAKGDPAKMMNFTNSWLGEIFEEKVEDPKPELVKRCRTDYQLGQVPEGVRVVVAGVDVQKRYLPFVIRGWGPNRESWLLATGRADDFEQLADVLVHNTYGGHIVRLAMIDSRYRSDHVLEFHRRYPAQTRMVRGVVTDQPQPFRVTKLERHPRSGAVLKHSPAVWHVNVDFFKDELAGFIRMAERWHLPSDPPQDYLEEVSAEHKVLMRSGAQEKELWVKRPGHERNDRWDCEVYALAAARSLHVEKMGQERSRPRPGRRPRGPDLFERYRRRR